MSSSVFSAKMQGEPEKGFLTRQVWQVLPQAVEESVGQRLCLGLQSSAM